MFVGGCSRGPPFTLTVASWSLRTGALRDSKKATQPGGVKAMVDCHSRSPGRTRRRGSSTLLTDREPLDRETRAIRSVEAPCPPRRSTTSYVAALSPRPPPTPGTTSTILSAKWMPIPLCHGGRPTPQAAGAPHSGDADRRRGGAEEVIDGKGGSRSEFREGGPHAIGPQGTSLEARSTTLPGDRDGRPRCRGWGRSRR